MPSEAESRTFEYLTLNPLMWKNGELLIMPADGRWDLTGRLTL
jgi:hypothetical protein